MNFFTPYLDDRIDKEIKILCDIENGTLSLSQLTSAQQIMAYLAFGRPEFLPEHWSNASFNELHKRLSYEQRKALRMHKSPNAKLLHLLLEYLFCLSTLLFMSTFVFTAMAQFTQLFIEPTTGNLGSPISLTVKLYCWFFSFLFMTSAWCYLLISKARIGLGDILLHLIASFVPIYFAFSDEISTILTIVVISEVIILKFVSKNQS